MFISKHIYTPIVFFVLSTLALTGCGADAPTAPPLPTVPPSATLVLPANAPATPSAPSGAASATPAAGRVATTLPGSTATTPPAAATTATPPGSGAAASPTATVPAAAQAPTLLTPLPTELPLTPEQNPVGDISDAQVFIPYTAPDGSYQVEVPEGWARTATSTTVTFADKLDGVQITLAPSATAPTSARARTAEVPALQRTGRAVQVSSVQDVTLPGGSAVLIGYTSNSDPNPVTGKQVRQDNAAYLFFHNGQIATLHLWAPAGADNVDQWQRMAQSFRWP